MSSAEEISASFSELVLTTEKDVKLLSALATLRPRRSGEMPQETQLMELDSLVTNLEERMAELKDYVASERAALRLLEVAAPSVADQQSIITHLEHRLPQHVPRRRT